MTIAVILVMVVLGIGLYKIFLNHFGSTDDDEEITPFLADPPDGNEEDTDFGFDGYDKDEFPNAYYDDTWDMDDDGHTG